MCLRKTFESCLLVNFSSLPPIWYSVYVFFILHLNLHFVWYTVYRYTSIPWLNELPYNTVSVGYSDKLPYRITDGTIFILFHWPEWMTSWAWSCRHPVITSVQHSLTMISFALRCDVIERYRYLLTSPPLPIIHVKGSLTRSFPGRRYWFVDDVTYFWWRHCFRSSLSRVW